MGSSGALVQPCWKSIDKVEYDFEEFALEHGIPETLDPLPYRKAGSVFATGEEAEPVMTSAKNDPRLRTVVCRHWLRDLCMKGAACEFLHQYDLSKMPLCRHGDRCKVKDCPFRHISEADRLECVFYSQGFCIHGPFCRYKHVKKDRPDLPLVADFTLGLSQMQAGKDGVTARRPAPKPNEFYKVSLCKHFLQGECPFGDLCHFAHGEHELKKFPRGNDKVCTPVNDGELSDNMFGNDSNNANNTTVDYYSGGNSGGGKPCPIMEPENACFVLVLAASYRDVAMSTVQKQWYLEDATHLNQAFQNNQQVMIFFTVSHSQHIQGAALMTSVATKVNSSNFPYRVECEWYRTAELPISTAVNAAPDMLLPSQALGFCQNLSTKAGEALIKALWNSPLVNLYEPTTLDHSINENETTTKQKKTEEEYKCPSTDEVMWPTAPLPGFIFGCNSHTMQECLGRGIFGLPAHMKHAASQLRKGSSIFLYNVTDRLFFGIFEACSSTQLNMCPRAFSKNPKATSSPFPVQLQVKIALECPPLSEDDPVLQQLLSSRVGGRIGPLTFAQTQALATLLATQCQALSYMIQYTSPNNTNMKPPPIA